MLNKYQFGVVGKLKSEFKAGSTEDNIKNLKGWFSVCAQIEIKGVCYIK